MTVSQSPKQLRQLTAWNALVAEVMECDQLDTLLPKLLELLSFCCHFDSWMVAVFHANAQPTIIGYKEIGDMEDTYASGPYLLDPYYDYFRNTGGSGCFPLREVAPDNFTRTEFFRSYYRSIGITDEVGYVCSINTDLAIHVSVSRFHGTPKFRKSEVAWYKSAEPIVEAAGKKLLRLSEPSSEPSEGQRTEFHAYLQNTLQGFGKSILTRREQEVTQLLLKGNSARAIGSVLGISHETVRNHMRQIYLKLRINSQVGLFTLFFKCLNG